MKTIVGKYVVLNGGALLKATVEHISNSKYYAQMIWDVLTVLAKEGQKFTVLDIGDKIVEVRSEDLLNRKEAIWAFWDCKDIQRRVIACRLQEVERAVLEYQSPEQIKLLLEGIESLLQECI